MGGPKMETDRDILEVVKGMIDAGGCGVAFGRNIWQHKDPTAMIRAISMIIHRDATVEKALKELE
jgi:class I fructose-bisphosphate aldolase